MRTPETQRRAWRRVPVDDVGYMDSAALAALPDAELRALMERMEKIRYAGWRNTGGFWRREMGLDDLHGLRVLDYGCGTGMEALQYARSGNAVSVADVNQGSVDLACRLLALSGFEAQAGYLIADGPPYITADGGSFDLVVMNGVLHHIEHPVPVAREAARWLAPGGELRVMVYSDNGWRAATGTEPPDDVGSHPQRARFVRWGDEVGDWADWYSEARLAERFGEWFDVERFCYIAGHGWYATALLRRRG